MPTKPKANKAPKLFLMTGEEALAHRRKLALNQSDFWKRVAIGQSGGSRYESGRKLPRPVQILLHLAYAPEAQANAVLLHLRTQDKAAA
jgi:DNA-binding transcriptional regulator YiaG